MLKKKSPRNVQTIPPMIQIVSASLALVSSDTCLSVRRGYQESTCCDGQDDKGVDVSGFISPHGAKVALTKAERIFPYQGTACPPGSQEDPFDRSCRGPAYLNGELCGPSSFAGDSEWTWSNDEQRCVPSGKKYSDPDFKFWSRWAMGDFASYWAKAFDENIFAIDITKYAGYRYWTSGMDASGKPLGAGVTKPTNMDNSLVAYNPNTPYTWEVASRDYFRRYPGLLPGNGDDYYLTYAYGAIPLLGGSIVSQVLQLHRAHGMTKFCVFMEPPEYNIEGHILKHLKDLDGMLGSDWTTYTTKSLYRETSAVEIKSWTEGPLPTCRGSDGVDYAPSSLSPTSPWIEFTTGTVVNPTGLHKDCHVPGSRCHVDAAYHFAPYWTKLGMDMATVEYTKGSDGAAPGLIYSSWSKSYGSASTRMGHLLVRDPTLMSAVASLLPTMRERHETSILPVYVQGKMMQERLSGPDSRMDAAIAATFREYDDLVLKAIPDSCPIVEVVNKVQRADGTYGLRGGYAWLRMKDAYATMPVSEGYAPNLYLSLAHYMETATNVTVVTRSPQFMQKLYDPALASDPQSVWHKWYGVAGLDDTALTQIGNENWGRGGKARMVDGSWGRFTRLQYWYHDRGYLEATFSKVANICSGNTPDPIAWARTHPQIVIDENVNPGYQAVDLNLLVSSP